MHEYKHAHIHLGAETFAEENALIRPSMYTHILY